MKAKEAVSGDERSDSSWSTQQWVLHPHRGRDRRSAKSHGASDDRGLPVTDFETGSARVRVRSLDSAGGPAWTARLQDEHADGSSPAVDRHGPTPRSWSYTDLQQEQEQSPRARPASCYDLVPIARKKTIPQTARDQIETGRAVET